MDRRVLVADDDEKALGLMADVLEEAGLLVMRATNGREALDALTRVSIRVLVTDLHMPLMTGIEVLEHVRRRHDTTRVIIVSADGDAHARRQARALGAADYLSKPIDADDMVRRVARLLDLR